jgi:hypothetical protein
MTNSAIASAFVKSHVARHVLREAVPALIYQPSVGMMGTGRIATALNGMSPPIADACFTFFETLKVPSTLIAGASLASLFTFTSEVQETYNFSKLQVMLLRVYHMFSLLTFCFSITTLLTSQSATTSILLASNRPLASKSVDDALSFLRSNMNFEFLVARWTFGMSILSFFLSTTFRMFVEFGLFARTRRTAGTMVASMMSGVLCFLLSFANHSQAGLPGLWSSTKEVAMVRASIFVSTCNALTILYTSKLINTFLLDCLASCLCC